ncbi:MAG TPA: response regulator transcription factor [Thermomicrobiaceae bacterium]|nr:response regulator transcription factor [Thermomicrobiaceae bacterium]
MVRVLRVLVAAPYPVTRAGLRGLLAEETDLEVAGGAADPSELVARSEELAPDAVLLDAGDDPDPWLEDVWRLAGGGTLPPVVLLAGAVDAAGEVLRAGLAGLLLRDATPAEIEAALHAAAAGLVVLDRRAVGVLATEAPARPAPGPDSDAEPLTPREREVLQLIAEGLPNKAIAGALGISEHTVKFHVGAILDKLGAASRAEALARAARAGLIVL